MFFATVNNARFSRTSLPIALFVFSFIWCLTSVTARRTWFYSAAIDRDHAINLRRTSKSRVQRDSGARLVTLEKLEVVTRVREPVGAPEMWQDMCNEYEDKLERMDSELKGCHEQLEALRMQIAIEKNFNNKLAAELEECRNDLGDVIRTEEEIEQVIRRRESDEIKRLQEENGKHASQVKYLRKCCAELTAHNHSLERDSAEASYEAEMLRVESEKLEQRHYELEQLYAFVVSNQIVNQDKAARLSSSSSGKRKWKTILHTFTSRLGATSD